MNESNAWSCEPGYYGGRLIAMRDIDRPRRDRDNHDGRSRPPRQLGAARHACMVKFCQTDEKKFFSTAAVCVLCWFLLYVLFIMVLVWKPEKVSASSGKEVCNSWTDILRSSQELLKKDLLTAALLLPGSGKTDLTIYVALCWPCEMNGDTIDDLIGTARSLLLSFTLWIHGLYQASSQSPIISLADRICDPNRSTPGNEDWKSINQFTELVNTEPDGLV